MLNASGVACLAAGLAVVFKYKHENHIASLYSTHSWLGIFTVTLIFAQFALGVSVYALPGVPLLAKQHVYPLHAALGLASTLFAAAAVLSGIDHENTLLGCAYSVVNKDMDPAIHYSDIPSGCRVSNGLAVMVMVALLLAIYALTNLKSASAANDLPKGRAGSVAQPPGAGGGDIDRVYYGTSVRNTRRRCGRTAHCVWHR